MLSETSPLDPRSGHVAFVLDGEMFVVGGEVDIGPIILQNNDVWSFNPSKYKGPNTSCRLNMTRVTFFLTCGTFPWIFKEIICIHKLRNIYMLSFLKSKPAD
jgi:hypothetical protein